MKHQSKHQLKGLASKLENGLTNDHNMSYKSKKIWALVLILISCILPSLSWTHEVFWIFERDVHFRPGFLTAFLSIMLLSPLYVRNILIWKVTSYHIILNFLLFYYFGSLMTVVLGGDSFTSTLTTYLVVAAVVLSWLGMAAIAGISWILILVAMVYNITVIDQAMDVFGFVYVITGFFGASLFTELNPGQLFKEISTEFKNKVPLDQIKGDLQVGISTVATAVNPAAGAMVNSSMQGESNVVNPDIQSNSHIQQNNTPNPKTNP